MKKQFLKKLHIQCGLLRRMSLFIKEHETKIKYTNINEALMKKTNFMFTNYIFSEASEKDELVSCYFL